MPARNRHKNPVRTPQQQRSKATVAAIVEAGTRILGDHGWSRFTTNAVADRAGVSIGSLYEYFPDKHALVDTIASEHLARGETLLAAAAATDAMALDKPRALVDALVAGLISLHQDDPNLHRMISSEVPLSAAIRERADALRGNLIRIVATALATQSPHPRLAAQMLVDTADSVIHR